jgi:NADP-dependent 3-hydroxy acid dehydrogenase YdfG
MLMKDKVGLVTGGGSGMGRATALALAGQGAQVVLVGRREDKLATVRDEIVKAGGRAEIRAADVSRREENQAIVSFIESRFGASRLCFQ